MNEDCNRSLNNNAVEDICDDTSEIIVDGVSFKCYDAAFNEDTVGYESSMINNEVNEEMNIDNSFDVTKEMDTLSNNSQRIVRNDELVEELASTSTSTQPDSCVTANEDEADNEEMTSVESKNYSCDQCSKSFAHYRNLSSHKRTHDKKFKCTECPAEFINLSNLSLHKKLLWKKCF
ncbi:zinc finger and SCAN domain-containing protein 16-like protein [Leptotrombidium deliense]|uniref:Zinc finger and SCAN domain-containing protein 16-like protein n=1 Tax=Leptotrombidium deliense TaxID=299467 RepID=A0A443RSD8_9ACAR|nr:zinc finger and SCAN domain-containing protein 16-like protein [Leptotrombidium deliense]